MATSKNSRIRAFLSLLGPGLVSGAADDDPSGIATYSQVGAQFGLGMLWTTLFSFPFMTAVQEISAHIGRVTGSGISANIRRHYPRGLLYGICFLLAVTNTINVGTDLGMMAAVLQLLIGGPILAYVGGVALLTLLMEIFIPYKSYVFYLKWMAMVLFAYVAAAFTVQVPWKQVALATFWPDQFHFNAENSTALLALLGTTISPYLFFWQASEEAEEVRDHIQEHPLRWHPDEAPRQLHRIRWDTIIGMAFSNGVAFFIILTTAVVLHTHGITQINTPAEAAVALRPLAGNFAFLLFALGILGTGLLAIPVLAGSAAYALGETFRWPVSLQRPPKKVKGFYALLAGCLVIGALLNLLHFNVIRALYWTAVLNGVVCVPVLIVMMLMAANPAVMGDLTISRGLRIWGWLTTALMILAVGGLGFTWTK